ncbi:MAG: NosD domain-containing protein [Candidatus Bathyarchaeia archaeon]
MRRLGCVSLTLMLLIFLSLLTCFTTVYPAQAYTSVNGTICSDTTWTKAGSPYNFTSNIIVAADAALTIEPGVTVNLNDYFLIVNGTLNAQGTETDKIVFQKATNTSYWYIVNQIDFTQFSQGWNEYTGQGSIVENAVLRSVEVSFYSSAKFSNVVSDRGLSFYAGSPTVTNCRFNVSNGFNIFGGSPLIANNVLVGSGRNTGIYCFGGEGTISGNTISRFGIGVSVNAGKWLINANTVSECINAIELSNNADVTIQKNLLNNNTQYGITGNGKAYIDSNTIANNQIGIHNPPIGTTIRGNNIVGNLVNSITATTPDVDAANNYWGTTDLAVINWTIYDYYDDATWGKVTFTPILTEPNPDAPLIPALLEPIVTPPPSTQPAQPSPSIQPTPTSTPAPTVDHNIIKNDDNQDRSFLNLNWLVVALAVPLAAVWAVVLLGYRVKAKIDELRRG